MKAHVEPKSRECPFCGAIVSFNNKDCDERGISPVRYFNRRAEREQKNESDS
jgi:hypothetical protein